MRTKQRLITLITFKRAAANLCSFPPSIMSHQNISFVVSEDYYNITLHIIITVVWHFVMVRKRHARQPLYQENTSLYCNAKDKRKYSCSAKTSLALSSLYCGYLKKIVHSV